MLPHKPPLATKPVSFTRFPKDKNSGGILDKKNRLTDEVMVKAVKSARIKSLSLEIRAVDGVGTLNITLSLRKKTTPRNRPYLLGMMIYMTDRFETKQECNKDQHSTVLTTFWCCYLVSSTIKPWHMLYVQGLPPRRAPST
jgi:hypothetical protein